MTMTFPRTWALIIGWALTALGVVGFLTGRSLVLFHIGASLSAIYLVTGLVALFFGYYLAGRHTRSFDQVIGFVYAALAVAGIAVAGISTATLGGILVLNPAVNALNAVVAVVSLIAGYASRKEMMPSEAEREEEERMHKVA